MERNIMKYDEIYHEEIPFLAGKIVIALMATISIAFLILFVIQLSGTSVGDNPASNWYYLVMGLFFIGVTVLVSNFRKLIISINKSSDTTSYGRISYRIALDNIEAAFVDTNPGIVYGGWGIRMARIKGRSALIYNVIAKPRVVLTLRTGRFGQFAFSTRRPDEVISLITRK
jgi:hypothetical protein